MRYMVVIEQGPNSFGAYVPDLPGCIAAAETKQDVLRLIREAIEFHLEGLKDEEGVSLPQPSFRPANSSMCAVDARSFLDHVSLFTSLHALEACLRFPQLALDVVHVSSAHICNPQRHRFAIIDGPQQHGVTLQ